MSKRTVGVAAVIISAVVFGFLPLCVTYLKGEGGTTLSVAFCRFFLSLLPIFVYLKVKKIDVYKRQGYQERKDDRRSVLPSFPRVRSAPDSDEVAALS